MVSSPECVLQNEFYYTTISQLAEKKLPQKEIY